MQNASDTRRSMSCVDRFSRCRSRPSSRKGGRFSIAARHSCTARARLLASSAQSSRSRFNRMSSPSSKALNRSVHPSVLRHVIL